MRFFLVSVVIRKEGQSMENKNVFYDVKQTIEYVCLMSGTSKTQLAKKIGMSQQQFEYRLKTGKFSIEEWKRIGNALNMNFQFSLTPNIGENVAPLSVAVPVLVNEE